MNTLNWILDFDDTLASGNITWVLERSIPQLVSKHQLTYDPLVLNRAMLRAQERAVLEISPTTLMHEMFETLGWSPQLGYELFEDLQSNYVPSLYADTLPFLERLRDAKRRVFIVSNNPLSLSVAHALGVMEYVSAAFTPRTCPGTKPKPHRGLWEYVALAAPDITAQNSVVVGDDPWTDGGFAASCGLRCWIVDRRDRLKDLEQPLPYHRVHSLDSIPLD